MKRGKMKIGSLFAGIGGIEIGFEKAGFECAWGIEIDKKACQTYKANHKHTIINADISKVDLGTLSPIDILTDSSSYEPKARKL